MQLIPEGLLGLIYSIVKRCTVGNELCERFYSVCMADECLTKISFGLQVELILIAEDLLRLTGSHKRFTRGRKTVKPNYEGWIQNRLDEIQ